ncbi:MAG: hypothetical protein KDA80_15190 [Planctomycetaceae bacterium]|nr:hypothetical protein [Planctomycetaceae bacterium]
MAADSLRQIAGKLLAAAAKLSGSADEIPMTIIRPEYRFSFGRELVAEIAVFNVDSEEEAELRARELMALLRGAPSDQPAHAIGAA